MALAQSIKDYFRPGYYSLLQRLTSGFQKISFLDLTVEMRCTTKEELKDYWNYPANFSERVVLEDMLSRTTPTDTFFDIGAKTGLYSCFIGQISAEVVAFEPHPANATRLRENYERNEIDALVNEYALTNYDGTIHLTTDDTAPGTGTHSVERRADEGVEVDCWKLSTAIETFDLHSPDVMKIDVEGSELNVIKGMSNLLENDYPRLIYIEVHDRYLCESEQQEIRKTLGSCGYESEVINRRPHAHHLRALYNES